MSFVKNVIEGAKMVNPGSIYRGVTGLGSSIYNEAKKDIGSIGKKKAVAAKMVAPKTTPVTTQSSQQNPGFSGYQQYLRNNNF